MSKSRWLMLGVFLVAFLVVVGVDQAAHRNLWTLAATVCASVVYVAIVKFTIAFLRAGKSDVEEKE